MREEDPIPPKPRHIVLLSGGLASFEAARRVISKYGREDTGLWFFDTLIEDADLYRFLRDAEKYFGLSIQYWRDGRNPWQVFRDERFIGNAQADLCSKWLKRILLERELRQAYPDKSQVVLYFGLDWGEQHRIAVLRPKWEDKGYRVEFPLVWEPWLFPDQYAKMAEASGISPPRLYALGFSHNNCGGACVKAGIRQWSHLYKVFPEKYRWHEAMEHSLRLFLRKNVSILRNRKGRRTRPLTLRNLRLRLEAEKAGAPYAITDTLADDAACSCFVNVTDI